MVEESAPQVSKLAARPDVWGEVAAALRIPASTILSLDAGQLLRTAVIGTLAHPTEARGATLAMLKAIKETGARELDEALRADPLVAEIMRADPKTLTTIAGKAGIGEQEDVFIGSQFARRIPGLKDIPVLGKVPIIRTVPSPGDLVRVSEDTFTTFNNYLRVAIIKRILAAGERAGKFASHEALESEAIRLGFADRKELAVAGREMIGKVGKEYVVGDVPKWVRAKYPQLPLKPGIVWTEAMDRAARAEAWRFKNVAALSTVVKHMTGRGGFGAAERFLPAMSIIDLAPRWVISYPQLVWDLINPTSKMTPFVRQNLMRDMGVFIGAGTAAMAAAAAAGARVEKDPKSSDFGKIQFGNTRVNIFGAFTTPIRYIAQAMWGETTAADTGTETKRDWEVTAGKFFRSKLAPAPALIWDIIAGSDFINRPLEKGRMGGLRQAYRRLTPLFAQDVKDQIALGSTASRALLPVAFFGLTEQAYESEVQKFWLARGGRGQLRDQPEGTKQLVERSFQAQRRRERKMERQERQGREAR